MSQKCYITGAGTHYYNDNFIPDDDDFVIAADGGYIFNSLHNIRTNLVIGDFDSLEYIPKKSAKDSSPTNSELSVLANER